MFFPLWTHMLFFGLLRQVAPVPSVPRPPTVVAGTRWRNGLESLSLTVTAYTAGVASTGKAPGSPGYGITASGVPVQSDWTLAGPNWMPFGTLIYLPRLGEWFQVQDRGSLIHGHHIDLYMSSTRAALAWGSQTLRAWVLLPNAGTGS